MHLFPLRFPLLAFLAVLFSLALSLPTDEDITSECLECTICYDSFRASDVPVPYDYPCHSHEFCPRCLDSLFDIDPSSLCPKCRRPRNNHKLQLDDIVAYIEGRKDYLENYNRLYTDEDKEDAFLLAVLEGDLKHAKRIRRSVPKAVLARNNAALRIATAYDHENIVRWLLSIPSVNPSANQNEAIQSALENGNSRVFEILYHHPQVNISDNNNRLLSIAAERGDEISVHRLLFDPRFDFRVPSEAVFLAASENNMDMVRLLIKDGRLNLDGDLENAIHIAASDNDAHMIKEIFEMTPNHSYKDVHGSLVVASWSGFDQVIRVLLQRDGYDPGAFKNSAIIYAARYGRTEVLEMLLRDPRVDVNARKSEPLFAALSAGEEETALRLLRDHRMNVFARDGSALFVAIRRSLLGVVEYLISGIFDPAFQEDRAIYEAAKVGNVEIAEMLMRDKRVNPAAKRQRAMKAAVRNGHLPVLKLLMEDPRVNLEFVSERDLQIAKAQQTQGTRKVLNYLRGVEHPSPRMVRLKRIMEEA